MCKHLHILTECLLQINLGEQVLKDLAHQFYINYINIFWLGISYKEGKCIMMLASCNTTSKQLIS